MSAPSILHPHEDTYGLFNSAEPWQDSRQIAGQTALTPNTNLRATLQDLTNVARNLPTEEALVLEIEKLCTATLTIDKAFQDIGRKLSAASKEQNRHVHIYDTCSALETRWNEHHQTYKNLLWRSRELAGEAQGAVDDFCEVTLPALRDQDKTRSEKEEIMREQIEVLQDTSQSSQDLCQQFLDFGEDLDTYIIEFSRVVEGFGIGEQRVMVDGLRDELRSARGDMEAISKDVKELGWKLAGDVAVAGIALLLAFVVPTLWAKLADAAAIGIDFTNVKRSGFQFLEARRQRDSAVTTYEAIRAKYDLEYACLGQMVELESILCDSRPLVQEVTAKLGIFANVWAAITADIRKLKNSLKHANDPTSKLFVRRVERLEKMYGYLSQALRLYQITVRLPQ